MNKRMILMVAAIALAAGLGWVASASAQGPRGGTECLGYPWMWAELVDAVGDASGLTDAEVRQQVREGMTLAAICEANNCDLDAVRAAATAEVESAIAVAVENGRLTQDQADEWLAALPDAIDAALESTHPMAALLGAPNLERVAAAQLVQTLRLMGDFTRADLLAAAQDDSTLADLAAEAGLDEADVIAQALEHLGNQLQVWVDRERITADQRDAALDAAATNYPQLMQQPISELDLAAGGPAMMGGVRGMPGMPGMGVGGGMGFSMRGGCFGPMDESFGPMGGRFGRMGHMMGQGRFN